MRRVFPWGWGILVGTAFGVVMWQGYPWAARGGIPLQEMRIIVDPGHGGGDAGVRGVSGGRPEKDWTLLLAKELQREARRFSGLRVVLSRRGDEDLPWRRRKEMARSADCWISLHLNAELGGSARGSRLFYPWGVVEGVEESEPSEEDSDIQAILGDLLRTRLRNDSVLLAQHLQRALEGADPLAGRHHPVRSAPLRGLCELTIPAVLVELGFLTHPQDLALLQDPLQRRALLRALLQGIVDFFRDPRRDS